MLTAYPVIGKKKSLDICLAFVRGAGGQIATKYRGGTAFFYGVDESNREVWERVLAAGDEFWYCDNSVFDAVRGTHFRVTRNALQHTGAGQTDGKRFAALGIDIKPWRTGGEHFVVCPQSDHFMHVLAGYQGDWGKDICGYLRANSSRPIRYRGWNSDKLALARTLGDDLVGAYAMVVWSSAAAVTAALAGVPVIVQSDDCAARCMCGDAWELEDLLMPDDRLRWAGVLADNEFTLAEFADGTAWRLLHG